MRVNKETKLAIDGIYNGTLAHSIKKNSRYVLTGVAVGVVGGMMLAAVFRQSKLLFVLGGGFIGGVAGAMMTPPEKEKEKESKTKNKIDEDNKTDKRT